MKKKVFIDLSSLDTIRRDAAVTRDSLLTDEEQQEEVPPEKSDPDKHPVNPAESAAVSPKDPVSLYTQKNQESPEELNQQILGILLSGKSAAPLIQENHLMPSIVTDEINEAFFDEIGDNILECSGADIALVEDCASTDRRFEK